MGSPSAGMDMAILVRRARGMALAPGASCSFEFKVEAGTTDTIATFVTNTVTASGQSALTGQATNAVDRAAIEVVPAKFTCACTITISPS